jgi:DNA-binding IclR family transcriptional regulator
MGSSAMQKVLQYEQIAAECREMAAQIKNPRYKKQLEDMAEVWERLAQERRQGIVENEPNLP